MATINGQLVKQILIEGIITAKTGLHIGGSNMGMSIGGADATVVRNPLTNEPYIPGSSLKGKMRSLLERLYVNEHKKVDQRTGVVDNSSGFGPGFGEIKAGPFNNYAHVVSQIFGVTPEIMRKVSKNDDKPVSRLIVRDCPLTPDSKTEFERAKNTDMPFTEVKTEVVIDRITSAAVPRQMERVPAGAEFSMSIILNIYHDDKEKDLLQKVYESLCLVQNDYLGGKGTRGSGEVGIEITAVQSKDKDAYINNKNWEKYESKIPTELKPLDNNPI